MMAHNEPGREPMEPTDAELEAMFGAWWDTFGWDMIPRHAESSNNFAARVAEAAWLDGAHNARRLMSGARPMLDTPAPDEVSRLEREISYTELRSAASRLSRVNTDLREQLDDSMQQNTALTARVAELEAELAGRAATVGINDDLLERNGELLAALENIRAKHHGDEAYNIACDALGVAR